MTVAGLNIEDSRIRASIISKRLGVTKPLRVEDIRLPETGEGKIKALRDALNRWKNELGIEGVVVGLDFKNFSHHFVELPVKSKGDISRALPFEMGKHLPLPPEEYLHDFLTIETSKTGTKNLVLSVRKEKLAWITECLKETGLKLLGFRCSVIEALNEFISSRTARDAIFLYEGEREYCIAGLRDYMPVHFKVMHNYRETVSELERLKEVFGKGAYVANVKDMSPFEGLNIREVSFSMPQLIALSAIRKRAIKIGFMPEEFVPEKFDYYPHAIIIMSVLAVLIFFLTAVMSYYKDYAALKAVEARIDEIKSTAYELVETKKELETIEEKMRFLFDFQQRRNINIKVLRQLSIILPEEAWLTNFSVEKGRAEIRGFAGRAANIIEPLEKSALFKKVEFSTPVTVKDGMERFSLKMELER